MEKIKTYLDYNATAPLHPEVKAVMMSALDIVGNASSIHSYGQSARSAIEQARKQMASLLGCRDTNIIFTGSATEANNTILNGLPECDTILVSASEHPSILNANDKIKTIKLHNDGLVDLNDLETLLKNQTGKTLVSIHAVNSETGVIQPVKEIANLVHNYGGVFHCDAVQAAGRVKIDYLDWGTDFITLSAHKIAGPQGIGAIIAADLRPFTPFIKGGGQEKRRRAGTENIAGILGFAKALEIAMSNWQNYNGTLLPLQDKIEETLLAKNIGVKIIGIDAPRVCNTVNIITPNITSETQLMFMDINGIAVSSGSACSSGTVKASHVLKAMNIDDAEANCSIRLSMGWNTKKSDVERFLAVYDEMLKINLKQ